MRKIALVPCILLLVGLAPAQIPTHGNVFAGYSYYNTGFEPQRRTGLTGWQGSFEGKIIPMLGIVVDISGNSGTVNFTPPGVTCPTNGCPTNIQTHVDDLLFGPRVSVSVGRWRPFAEALFGIAHVTRNGNFGTDSTSGGTDNSFATAIGGGLDYKIIRPIAVRFQIDYVRSGSFSTTQNSVRLGTGIVVRF